MSKVYLAGPINGCGDDECKAWRAQMIDMLPTRCEYIDPMRRDYRGLEDQQYRMIVDLDKVDIQNADIVIANCSKTSVGTSMEVLFAWWMGIPVIVIHSGNPSPWLRYHSTAIAPSVKDAALLLRSMI